jgi:hypothetical protein
MPLEAAIERDMVEDGTVKKVKQQGAHAVGSLMVVDLSSVAILASLLACGSPQSSELITCDQQLLTLWNCFPAVCGLLSGGT